MRSCIQQVPVFPVTDLPSENQKNLVFHLNFLEKKLLFFFTDYSLWNLYLAVDSLM